MANQICPSCGAPYNGKKCRFCLYQPMDSHQTHNTQIPVQPFPRKKQKTAVGSLAGLLVILALVALVLPALRLFGLKLDAMEAAQRTPESLPESCITLYRQNPISILSVKPDASDCREITLWIQNTGHEDLAVICSDVIIDGSREEYAGFSAAVPGNSIIRQTVYTYADIQTLQKVTASFEVLLEDGRSLLEADSVVLYADSLP